ncbi:MAG: hypothetical protein Q9220_001257 [cf. Caloplaca sp. 1 TL-2023]
MARERYATAVEVLSPRSTNIQSKPQTLHKQVVESEAAKYAKPKDHASPPPSLVIQPPQFTGGLTVQYRIGKELGKGGFAICYEGQQRGAHGGQTYALKIVKATMAQKKMEEKFRTELQIHAKMRHPNIVEFHRAFTFKENTYVVLELCPNGSVQDMVRARRGISLPEIRRLVIQLCGAIKYMHARNVIHRDLKMGNLFLDHELNVKIGDFGLAAVLVSPGEYRGAYTKALSRRTTLCGTPNYIAPEILDKGKGGHDLKVDIWALGCIVYAMICCRPPFQAASSTEIYEKAKTLDYQWPRPETIRSHVPEEAKDLVAGLLKPNPKERLQLDEVVSHPFFSMHGANCIPLTLDPSCKEKKPGWLSSAEPRGDVMNANAPRMSLRDLARMCGVGSFEDMTEPFEVVGGDVDLSLYKACLIEEIAETCPKVPLPADTVYVGKVSTETPFLAKEPPIPPVPSIPQSMRFHISKGLDALPEHGDADIAELSRPGELFLERGIAKDRVTRTSHTRSTSTSHGPSQNVMKWVNGVETQEVGHQVSDASASMRLSSAGMQGRPIRISKTLPRSISRVTRSQKTGLTEAEAIPIHDEEPKISRRLTKDEIIDQLSPNPDEKRRELALRGKARIAANLQNELNALSKDDRKSLEEGPPTASKEAPAPVGWLVSSKDTVKRLPGTIASDVCSRLELLRDELESALVAMGKDRDDPKAKDLGSKEIPRDTPPLVTKWVDYTNKLGVGYTLDNGSMGCLIKANEGYDNPQCGVVVAHTRRHYRSRKDPSYGEADQILPQAGPPVEFTEFSEEQGITRILVPANRFKITAKSRDGLPKMNPTRDIHETEKRRRLSIWTRFADYMINNLAPDTSPEPTLPPDGKHVPGPSLRFYQRLGNVSIWAFADGALQFNFPDHTKFVLHRDGKWIEFYYLPTAVVKRLVAGKALDQQMLDSRRKLSDPPSILLALSSSKSSDSKDSVNAAMASIVQANEVKRKIEFVRDVLGIWTREGGLGKLGKDKYFKWDGFQAKKGLAWVSVGACGGDAYYKLKENE